MWADIINTIVTLATTGGVVYLIIEKLFERKRSKAETKTVEISNSNDVADLYNKIDDIVERKNAIIKTELREVKQQLEEIRGHWCCYREECNSRILYRQSVMNRLANETKKHVCKD